MNRVALNFGFIKIYWYSIFILLGMIAAFLTVHKEIKSQKIDEDKFLNLVFYLILFGIIGARLYYVLFNIPYYLKNPQEIIAIWNGGLAIHGGILSGLIVLIYFCKKNNLNLIKILDILVVGLIIAQAIGRWGNFFNQEAYGATTTLMNLKRLHIPTFIIEGMCINGVYYHPTFFYESTWCFIGFLIMMTIRHFKLAKEGLLTSFYLIWYGIERFFIEGLRTDSLMLGSIKIAQLVSIMFIILGLAIIIYYKKIARLNRRWLNV